MENNSEYFIKNPKQIYSHLNQLLNKKCLISAHFGDHNASFITTILEIDQKNNRLILDYGPKEYLNKQLLNSAGTEFRTEFDGIKVSFSSEKITKVRHKNVTFFSMPLPSSLFWMQRRKFYRIKVPLAHNSYCQIKFTNEEENIEQSVQFKLVDISLSGFAFANDQLEYSNVLIPTSKFEDCTLLLNDGDHETISFVVKNKFNLNPNKPDKGQRVGCAFSKISTVSESNVQRYMQNIERELKAVR